MSASRGDAERRAVVRSKATASSRQWSATRLSSTAAGEDRRQHQVGIRQREDVAEEQPWTPGGESGESASSAPSPNKPVTTTATAVSRPMPGTRPTSAIASAATAIPGIPPTSRDPAEGGDHQPGKSAWDSDSAA